MDANQRRGFLKSDQLPVYGELDTIYQLFNSLSFPPERKVRQDYKLDFQDRFVSCMRAGLVLTLPTLGREEHGLVCLFKDKSGGAAASNIVITPPPGKTIDGAATLSITTNYGFKKIQWDSEEANFFEIS